MKYFDNILVCGDIHGDVNVITDFIKKMELHNCAIIVAGDYGIGFEYYIKEIKKLEYFNKLLNNSNSTIYAVRGNHDDPNYFNGKYDTEFIKLVPDYTILEINQWNILCVGGATSIDRTNRKKYNTGKGRDWWINETFYYDENKVNQFNNIDIVVTHTAPNFTYPLVKNGLDYWLNRDIHLINDIKTERDNVTKLYEHLKKNNNIIKWYYGHFHNSYNLYYDNTNFIGLNINEFREIKL